MTMLIWFKSDAIVEWGSLFGLSKLFKVIEFYKMRLDFAPSDLNYPTFLKEKYKNFITKMLSCPLCLSVWLSNIFCFTSSVFLLDPFYLIMTPVVCILVLFIYGIINKLYS